MSDSPKTYKIRRGQLFSNGVIVAGYARGIDEKFKVTWNKKGKEWKTEKALKEHLTKWISLMGSIPADWEIFEVHYKSTPVAKWIDDNMLITMMSFKKED